LHALLISFADYVHREEKKKDLKLGLESGTRESCSWELSASDLRELGLRAGLAR
jgi:hypothetical protein